MRTLWNMLSFLAVVNLLALVMLGLWLWRSDRLDRARLERVREMFAVTINEEEAAAATAAAAVAESQASADSADPLLPAAAQLGQISRLREREILARRRMAEEQRQLVSQLEAGSRRLDERRAALRQERQDWEKDVQDEQVRAAEEQFAKAVRQLESIPSKQAKAILVDLIEAGKTDQAVAYLDAMSTRGAAKVLREFKSDRETALATDLLERLRRYGVREGAAATSDRGSGSDLSSP